MGTSRSVCRACVERRRPSSQNKDRRGGANEFRLSTSTPIKPKSSLRDHGSAHTFACLRTISRYPNSSTFFPRPSTIYHGLQRKTSDPLFQHGARPGRCRPQRRCRFDDARTISVGSGRYGRDWFGFGMASHGPNQQRRGMFGIVLL